MSAFYDLYETPDPNDTGEKQPLHARIVPSGTYSKKDFIERVSRHQPFPHNIIEGVLGAVVDELAEAWRMDTSWNWANLDISAFR